MPLWLTNSLLIINVFYKLKSYSCQSMLACMGKIMLPSGWWNWVKKQQRRNLVNLNKLIIQKHGKNCGVFFCNNENRSQISIITIRYRFIGDGKPGLIWIIVSKFMNICLIPTKTLNPINVCYLPHIIGEGFRTVLMLYILEATLIVIGHQSLIYSCPDSLLSLFFVYLFSFSFLLCFY